VNNESIAPVLGRIPSGISILIVGDGTGRETGMLASWVQQASFGPPMVTVAVNRKRYLNDWLLTGAPVTLNLLSEDDGKFLKHFGKGFEPDAAAFEGLNLTRAANGLPMLADAMGCLEGKVVSRTDAGDHYIYVIELTAATAGADLETGKPWVHIRKNGLNY
jgi:flavin reductase (DIM6/NTAB) family NADH-FMN oxidoreductase RutF